MDDNQTESIRKTSPDFSQYYYKLKVILTHERVMVVAYRIDPVPKAPLQNPIKSIYACS